MRAVLSRPRSFDEWLLADAPAARLAVFRVLTGGFALVYVLIRTPALWALTRRPEGGFEAVGVLWWMDQPPGRALVVVLLATTLTSGLAFVVGWRFAWSGPLFALTLLATTTFHSSWGQLLHFENLFVLHVLIIGSSPSADALAPRAEAPVPSARYGWPLRLAALVTVATYVIAGVAKLRIGGTEWLFGDTLRNHIAYSAARLDLLGGTPTPVAEWVIDWTWAFPPLAVATVLIELAAPAALVSRSLRNAWVGATVAMHLAIFALLAVLFPYQGLGFAFAPFFALEVAAERLRRRRPSHRSRDRRVGEV